MKPLRIGLIGAGHMGRRHAQKVASLGPVGVTLSGVADLDVERARGLAAEHQTRAVADANDLFSEADAAIVAVPTTHHFATVSAALEAGLDVLVEKPIAATLDEGECLVDMARRRGRVLHVGHLERFNAALQVIRHRISAPRFVEVQRVGPFPDRNTDVDVVRDLMIHDLDILQQILGEEPDRIDSIGVPVLTSHVDIANARIHFPSGCVADLTASRVSTRPRRRMRFFQRDGYFTIDFLAHAAAIHRRVGGDDGEPARIEVESLAFDVEDALLQQLRAFVDAVRNRGESDPSASDALVALRTALRVVDAMPRIDESA